jgi:prepilin-type N-terminal cleavage/methylation domain-containing protein
MSPDAVRHVLRKTRRAQTSAAHRVPSAPIRGAVTLVELVIVMLIMGILAAAAAPTFYESLAYHRVESAARRVKADLQRLRQAARLTSSPQSITFDGATAYTLSEDVADLDHPSQTYSVDLAARPYQLDVVTIDFGGDSSITFDGYGNPSRGGSLVLRAADYACTVTLDATTGRVTKSDTRLISAGPVATGN